MSMTPPILGRRLLLAAAAIGALPTRIAGAAEGFPQKPIRVLIPHPPGGITDVAARLAGGFVQGRLGQPCVMENRTGAAGSIAANVVARAAPDGHTLLMGTGATHGTTPSTFTGLPYDPVTDFEPIVMVASSPLVVVVRSDSPARDFPALLNLARSRQPPLTFGSTGTGGAVHLAVEMFKVASGVPLTHVPYRGSAPALNDLLAGQIDFMFDNVSSAMPLVGDGKLRALAVTSEGPSDLAPGLPAVSASGVPGYTASSWVALFAPRGTPVPVLTAINGAVNAGLRSEDGRAAFRRIGLEPGGGTPEALRAHVNEELTRWATAVKAAGLTPARLGSE